jgi:hypothetical protein
LGGIGEGIEYRGKGRNLQNDKVWNICPRRLIGFAPSSPGLLPEVDRPNGQYDPDHGQGREHDDQGDHLDWQTAGQASCADGGQDGQY